MNTTSRLLSFTMTLGALAAAAGCAPASTDDTGAVGDDAFESFLPEGGAGGGKADAVLEDRTGFGVLLVSNTLSLEALDREVGLDRRAADSIVAFRAGEDEKLGTEDDRFIMDLKTLDGLFFVGPAAYGRLADYARGQGWDGEKGMALLLGALLDHQGGQEGRAHFMLPEEGDLDAIPQDPRNRLTPEKVALGRLLFHDRALAVNPRLADHAGTYSCASCHHAGGGFGSGNVQGFAEGGVGFGTHGEARVADPKLTLEQIDTQPVKTPPALNLNWHPVVLTNGALGAVGPNQGTEALWKENHPTSRNALGFEGVETQAIAGLAVHGLIDDAHPERTEASELVQNPIYRDLFEMAFPEGGEFTGINQITTGLAIAAFERTIMAQRAPFQRFLQGDDRAMTPTEVEGAILFFGQSGCVSCHSGPALSSQGFHAVGFTDLDQFSDLHGVVEGRVMVKEGEKANLGRASFTGDSADNFAFKVPQLYNLRDHAAYGHGGGFETVRQVVDYFNEGVVANPRVDKELAEIEALDMTPGQCAAIARFIEDGLHDSELHRFVPETLPSALCGINGDEDSLNDLGCR